MLRLIQVIILCSYATSKAKTCTSTSLLITFPSPNENGSFVKYERENELLLQDVLPTKMQAV